jgi:ribosomal protein S27AE
VHVKTIDIAYEKPVRVPISALNDFQGELKTLSEESYSKLSKEITSTGFAFAPHAWRNPKDRKWYLVDGHQRIKAVRRLCDESGYKIEPIQVIPVKAKSYEEAKRRVLQAASQYGEVIPQGLYEFLSESEIKFDDFKESFDFPTLNIEKFAAFFEKPKEESKNNNSEVDGGQFSKLVHTCPQCGHKFARE